MSQKQAEREGFRFFENNTLDTVPYGRDRVLDTRHFYEPAPQGGLLVEAAPGVMALRRDSLGSCE